MPIRELGDLLGTLTGATKKGRKFAAAGKRAWKNFERLDGEQRVGLGKKAVGKALLYVADTLAGPDIRVAGVDDEKDGQDG